LQKNLDNEEERVYNFSCGKIHSKKREGIYRMEVTVAPNHYAYQFEVNENGVINVVAPARDAQ